MDSWYYTLVLTAAFLLGGCPFSLWIGRALLRRDIRQVGDGNPGSANVFRAGGRKIGMLAVTLDVAKGTPFVLLASALWRLPDPQTAVVGLAAILGSAFSPLLRFRGGKSVAVTYGVLAALPQKDLFVCFAVCMFLGILLLEADALTTVLGPLGALAYLLVADREPFKVLFVVCVLTIFVFKQRDELRAYPNHDFRVLRWLR